MTDISKLVGSVRFLGFEIYLSAGNVKLKYTKEGEPSSEAISLMDAIRNNKTGVIKYLEKLNKSKPQPESTPEQFESTFNNAVGEINRNYRPGTLDFIRQKYPERWTRSLEVENRLNHLWDDGKGLEAFEKAVDEWRGIQLELIKLFTKNTAGN